MLSKSTPVDREISVNPNYTFNCKISSQGILEFTSHILCEISGYEEYELIDEPLISLAHPDMPNLFFEVLTERLAKSQPMHLFAKLMAKDGRYYWLMMDFSTKLDQNGAILAHYSKSIAASPSVVHKLQSLYKILSKIENKTGNTKASRRYLVGYLEERNLNYDQLIKELLLPQVKDEYTQYNTASLKENNTQNIDVDTFENMEQIVPVVKIKKSLFRRIFG